MSMDARETAARLREYAKRWDPSDAFGLIADWIEAQGGPEAARMESGDTNRMGHAPGGSGVFRQDTSTGAPTSLPLETPEPAAARAMAPLPQPKVETVTLGNPARVVTPAPAPAPPADEGDGEALADSMEAWATNGTYTAVIETRRVAEWADQARSLARALREAEAENEALTKAARERTPETCPATKGRCVAGCPDGGAFCARNALAMSESRAAELERERDEAWAMASALKAAVGTAHGALTDCTSIVVPGALEDSLRPAIMQLRGERDAARTEAAALREELTTAQDNLTRTREAWNADRVTMEERVRKRDGRIAGLERELAAQDEAVLDATCVPDPLRVLTSNPPKWSCTTHPGGSAHFDEHRCSASPMPAAQSRARARRPAPCD